MKYYVELEIDIIKGLRGDNQCILMKKVKQIQKKQ